MLHSIWETFMLHDLTVEVSVDPMVAVMLWQESEAVMYMCCPLRVPQTMGGFGPVGFEMTRLSLTQLPMVPVVVDGADMTKVSKSTLSWQMSEEEGQMV